MVAHRHHPLILIALLCTTGCGASALEQENQQLTRRVEELEARVKRLESSEPFRAPEEAMRRQREEDERPPMLRPNPPDPKDWCREIMLTDAHARLSQVGRPERIDITPECVKTPVQAAARAASMAQAEAAFRGELAQVEIILERYMDADGRDDAWAAQVEREVAEVITWSLTTQDRQQNPMFDHLAHFQGSAPPYSLRCGRTACLFTGPSELVTAFTGSFKRIESLGSASGFLHPDFPDNRTQIVLISRVGFKSPPAEQIESIARAHP